jgi:hypothetical protein
MIARITKAAKKFIAPTFDVKVMANEADVEHKLVTPLLTNEAHLGIPSAWVRNQEHKLVTPFLTNEAHLGIPSAWVRNQDYMAPTDIDKLAGKRYGYKPDQSIG